MELSRVRRVAVIGAGPAGAIATDALIKEQAFTQVRVFDRKSIAGGTWAFDPSQIPSIPSLQDLVDGKADFPVQIPQDLPCETQSAEKTNSHTWRFSDSGVYDNLHSNLPPSTMSFTQVPIPEIISQQTLSRYGPKVPFRHHSVVRIWVEDIFAQTGSNKLVEFNTTVELAEKRDDKWVLTLRKELPITGHNQWWQEEFDAVVVASGHYSIPYIPDIPKLAAFEDRHPGSIQHSKHFRSRTNYADKKVIVVGGSVSAFDALHDIRKVSKRPVIASLRQPLAAFGWAPFTHPHIEVRPPIANFNPSTKSVIFIDGAVASDVDVVLFATGYDFSFPFLPTVEISNRRIRKLYQHVFNINDPSLGFVGMESGGLTFRVFEWQAVALARFFAGRTKLPPKEQMEQWEAARASDIGESLGFFNIASDYEDYFEGLRNLASDPAAGTTGRVLPKYEKRWAEEFQHIIKARVDWWGRERMSTQMLW